MVVCCIYMLCSDFMLAFKLGGIRCRQVQSVPIRGGLSPKFLVVRHMRNHHPSLRKYDLDSKTQVPASWLRLSNRSSPQVFLMSNAAFVFPTLDKRTNTTIQSFMCVRAIACICLFRSTHHIYVYSLTVIFCMPDLGGDDICVDTYSHIW